MSDISQSNTRPPNTRCSIIVVVDAAPAVIEQCLNRLLMTSSPGVTTSQRGTVIELITVDRGRSATVTALLERYQDRIIIIPADDTASVAVAWNQAAARATGDHLVFVSPYVMPKTGWLAALLAGLGGQPDAVAAGARILGPDGTVTHAGVAIGQDRLPHVLYAGFPAHHPAVTKTRAMPAVTGGCLLVTRSHFQACGGFNPAYGQALAPIDLCLRLGQQGARTIYCGESLLAEVGQAHQQLHEDQAPREREAWREYWGTRLRPDDIEYYLQDGLLTVQYGSSYPIDITISPFLARVGNNEHSNDIFNLLHARARQVSALIEENAALSARLIEAESRK